MIHRKNRADTYLVGFQGHAVSAAANSCSVQFQPPGMTQESLEAIWSAPSLEEVMRRAARREAALLGRGESDALVSEKHAAVAWGMSRMSLETAGFLP